MNIQSVKTRFFGSYLALLVLFVVQIPIIYFVVKGITAKFDQVEWASSLRKRSVELAEVLNRHVTTGDEALEAVFQSRKKELDAVLGELKSGSGSVLAITDGQVLAKLGDVEKRWEALKAALDKGMDYGDRMKDKKAALEKSTAPMVDKVNEMIVSFEALKDPLYVKYINMSGFERVRTMKMSYLAERYFVSYSDRDAVSRELYETVKLFNETLDELKAAGRRVASRGARGARVVSAVAGVEDAWKTRSEEVNDAVIASSAYNDLLGQIVDVHTQGFVTASNDLTRLIVARSESSAMNGVLVLVVSVAFSALIAALFMWFTNAQLIRPVMKIMETVRGYTKGDLSKRADVKVTLLGREIKDEISSLGQSVDEMAEQMSKVLGRISESSSLLASASEQLSASSVQIEEGANKQSGQTGQVATAMEEMNATVVEVAKSAQQASESARGAHAIAAKGGEVVKQAASAMKEVADSTMVTAQTIKKLGKSSEEIGTIVSVINDIADQTNLLALNAAIEAARAGDQGRGFAVVADEVRKLAERTTTATKEISDMITSIQGETGRAVIAMNEGSAKVGNGVRLANEAGDALGQIVVGVQNVTDMISQMATSTEEQSATTDEISRNMESIAEVAKSNVTAVGEVSKATNEMARLAGDLKDLVANFRLSDETFSRPKRAVSMPAPNPSKKRKLLVVKETSGATFSPKLAVDNR